MPSPVTAHLPVPRSWDEFEDICADILKRIWCDPYVTRNGRSGQKQHGVDIYGTPVHLNLGTGSGILGAAQCKNTDKLLFSDIKAEVNKAKNFVPKPAEYIIMTTASRDADLQSQVRTHDWPFRVELRFWDDISLDLSGYPELLSKYYPTLIKTTVGTNEIIERVLSSEPEDYQYNDSTGVFLHHQDVKLQLRFERREGYDREFDEPWVRTFPDPSASRQTVYIEYEGTQIVSFNFVWVDGYRYLIPFPKSRNDLRISQTQYRLGRILGSSSYGYSFESGLQMAGIQVDFSL